MTKPLRGILQATATQLTATDLSTTVEVFPVAGETAVCLPPSGRQWPCNHKELSRYWRYHRGDIRPIGSPRLITVRLVPARPSAGAGKLFTATNPTVWTNSVA